MVQPINYMAMMPQVDPAKQFGQGFQLGANIRQAQAEQAAAEQAQALKAQYAADLQNAMQNPTASSFAALTAKYPGQREAFKQSWDMLSEDQKNSDFSEGSKAFFAIEQGRPDVAAGIIDSRISAMQNSGKDPGQFKLLRDQLDTDPKKVQAGLGFLLSAADPDRWGKVVAASTAGEKAQADLSEAQSRAHSAAVAAKFAESKAAQDLAKGGWDIAKLQNDISVSRQNTAIAAMNAQLAREGNSLKAMELRQKIDEANAKRDEAVRTKAADVEAARFNIDNMLNTADRVLATDIGVIQRSAGPIASQVPTLSGASADFQALLETLGSQSFIAQIPNIKGMGSLSNAEGEKLQSALQNLSLRQSPERLIQNVKEAQRLLLKTRKNVAERYGVPDTVPDTPAAQTTAADIDALLKKYGGR